MALNKFMHPRNPYRTPPDFTKLAIKYPEFRKFVVQDLTGKVKLNFKDEGAVRALTKSLLDNDFSLNVEIPPNHLIPTLPLRLNYLLWIEGLLKFCKRLDNIQGIDIGTGACCIYPLLGAKHFSWSMLATEVDEECLKYAKENVEKNNLEDVITVKPVTEDVVLDGILEGEYDFVMCNPPFFSDKEQLKMHGRSEARALPRNAPTGTSVELVAPGGEIAFIGRMIKDSAKLQNQIKIYTTMVGHKSSLGTLKKAAKDAGSTSVITGEFCQGRTTRWGLAWSYFYDLSKVEKVGGFPKHRLKPPLSYTIPTPPVEGEADPFEALKQKIISLITDLNITIEEQTEDDDSFGFKIYAFKNTWSGQRKVRRKAKQKDADSAVSNSNETKTGNTQIAPSIKRLADNQSEQNESEAKRLKLVSGKGDSESEREGPCLVVALITVYNCGKEVVLEISYLEGQAGRDATNQILQYLKNCLTKKN